MNRLGELLVVSIAGLVVNLVGIMSFEHGHAHHDHDHNGHNHGHGHGHSHGNENMHGIFLHILADTMGSVAVVISTLLVHFYQWSGFDPLASCVIAVLIFVSALPLVASTARSLLLTLPADVEYGLRDTLDGVSNLRGVAGYTVPRFWLDDTGRDEHGHEHSHSHDDHHHSHSHKHIYSHGRHGHRRSHGQAHSHSHGHSHKHNHDDHSHSHSHAHAHAHSHAHSQAHSHAHSHDHEQENKPAKILGVIHVMATRGADLEDVRRRTINFLQEKNMDILVQVEREGDAYCWCGGGK